MNWAAIFDWDGVIIDSSRAHAESWDRLAAEEQRVLPAGHFRRGFGMKNEKIIPELLGWTRDPFDRLLVAHAQLRGFKLATSDAVILERLDPREVLEL